jgi:hypothetical protein
LDLRELCLSLEAVVKITDIDEQETP